MNIVHHYPGISGKLITEIYEIYWNLLYLIYIIENLETNK